MNDSEIKVEQMRQALASIAHEIQRFHDETLSSNFSNENENNDVLDSILKYKTDLKLRREEIKRLRQNLKTACFVAKILSTSKEHEAATLTNQLTLTKNQYLEFVERQNEDREKILALTTENQALQNNLDQLNNFILLGYQELQKMRNESLETIPVLKQLQKIIVCCGEYYAEYCNEQEKTKRLEQKNRFLSNKLHILEKSLESSLEDIETLRLQNTKLNKERGEPVTIERNNSVMEALAPVTTYSHITNFTFTEFEHHNTKKVIDLSNHLNMVNKLISDQDDLLNILECLSKQLTNEEMETQKLLITT